jgi:hypothetical protein
MIQHTSGPLSYLKAKLYPILLTSISTACASQRWAIWHNLNMYMHYHWVGVSDYVMN